MAEGGDTDGEMERPTEINKSINEPTRKGRQTSPAGASEKVLPRSSDAQTLERAAAGVVAFTLGGGRGQREPRCSFVF